MKHCTIRANDGLLTVCQCCGHTFRPNKDMHYVAMEAPQGMIFALSASGCRKYDAVDCPQCDCQIIFGERLPVFKDGLRNIDSIDEMPEYGKEDKSDAAVDNLYSCTEADDSDEREG